MCPKKKSDHVQVHRIELQETEREQLEMIAASMTARNVTASVGNLIDPILSASVAGVAAALGLLAWIEITTAESYAQKAAGTNPNTGKPYTQDEIANAIPGPHSTYTDPTKSSKNSTGIGKQIEMRLTQFVTLLRGLDNSL